MPKPKPQCPFKELAVDYYSYGGHAGSISLSLWTVSLTGQRSFQWAKTPRHNILLQQYDKPSATLLYLIFVGWMVVHNLFI